MNRVFVTGIGLITPIGLDRESSWSSLCRGVSGARKISKFDASGWPVEIACEVLDFKLSHDAVLKQQLPYLNSPAEYAAEAAAEAFRQAGLTKAPCPERSGIILGSGIGVVKPAEVLNAFRDYEVKSGLPEILKFLESVHGLDQMMIKNHPATLNAVLSEKWGLSGISSNMSTACSAGAQAIGHSYKLIRDGEQDLMVAGGSDSLAGELLFAGFCLLGVMSSFKGDPTRAANPFDKDRSGFVAGEGAAILILESEKSMKARQANPIAEVIGYGETENAYRITDLPADGAGAIKAMEQAVFEKGQKFQPFDSVNAHGTGTQQNDKSESLAIESVFYDNGAEPIVTANKNQIGHFVAASGAVEAAFSILSIRDNLIPPLINFKQSDCSDRIKFASNNVTSQPVRRVISNSFGFGGTNASLAFEDC